MHLLNCGRTCCVTLYGGCSTPVSVQGGLWIPGDGVADPSGVCQSLAKGATQQGNHDRLIALILS